MKRILMAVVAAGLLVPAVGLAQGEAAKAEATPAKEKVETKTQTKVGKAAKHIKAKAKAEKPAEQPAQPAPEAKP